MDKVFETCSVSFDNVGTDLWLLFCYPFYILDMRGSSWTGCLRLKACGFCKYETSSEVLISHGTGLRLRLSIPKRLTVGSYWRGKFTSGNEVTDEKKDVFPQNIFWITIFTMRRLNLWIYTRGLVITWDIWIQKGENESVYNKFNGLVLFCWLWYLFFWTIDWRARVRWGGRCIINSTSHSLGSLSNISSSLSLYSFNLDSNSCPTVYPWSIWNDSQSLIKCSSSFWRTIDDSGSPEPLA